VQNVVQELRGEKIDIIPWHVDEAKFVCNALAPAEISRVIIDETNRSMEVIVPDEFLSVAIGKRGQNVRLASKLTGWHLDVISETQYNQTMQSGYNSLVQISGVGISMADALFEKGFYSAEELSNADPEDLVQIRGIGEEKAKQLIVNARQALKAAKAMAAEALKAPKVEPKSIDETAGESVKAESALSEPLDEAMDETPEAEAQEVTDEQDPKNESAQDDDTTETPPQN